ncbi:hypothetical protein ACFY05_29335 [Microtetraspora fusca]|uniref:Uncharacterized protein n=1 Tax=Microtetraspora fusca TaxID=1997 RepID=A0ABW6VCA8_MICFU
MISPEPRSTTEIRDYLVGELNSALRRPGMYGKEPALLIPLDHVAYVERQDEAWAEERETMRARGAFTAIGVVGAFNNLLPGGHDDSVASVYAEFARDRGWLEADRVLTADEHRSMRRELNAWVARDRMLSEVLETFGPPSVLFGGGNPRFPKTLAYVADQMKEPMLFLHFWNGADPDAEPTRGYEEPILLAIRCGRGPFKDTFTFTPEGRKRRPEVSDIYL